MPNHQTTGAFIYDLPFTNMVWTVMHRDFTGSGKRYEDPREFIIFFSRNLLQSVWIYVSVAKGTQEDWLSRATAWPSMNALFAPEECWNSRVGVVWMGALIALLLLFQICSFLYKSLRTTDCYPLHDCLCLTALIFCIKRHTANRLITMEFVAQLTAVAIASATSNATNAMTITCPS